MKGIACAWALALSGCSLIYPAMLAGSSMAPAGVAAAGAGDAEIGYVHVGANQAHGLDSGWGIGLRDSGFAGKRFGLAMYGRTEAGVWGRDRIYGLTGVSGGPGLRIGDSAWVGANVGYEWGGYPQIGHLIPVRALAFVHHGGLALRGSLYGGWRLGIRDEWPAATSKIGPGWNAWGGDLALVLAAQSRGLDGREGIALGIGFDRQDDISVGTVSISAALGKY